MKKLGWDGGFQIPIANAENKELEEQVARLTLRKTKTKNDLEKATSRLEGLKEHFKYVHQENEQNQVGRSPTYKFCIFVSFMYSCISFYTIFINPPFRNSSPPKSNSSNRWTTVTISPNPRKPGSRTT